MALPNWQRTIVTSSGDVIPNAEIKVVNELTGLDAVLFSNRAGTTSLDNPFFTGSDGFAEFYAEPAEYRVTATGPSGTATWRWESLPGTASRMANNSGGDTLGTAAVATLTTGPSDNTTGRVLRIGGNGWHGGNAPSDSAWTSTTTLSNGWTGTVIYKKTLGMVTISFTVNGSSATADEVLVFPSGYRTSNVLYLVTANNQTGTIAATGALNLTSRTTPNRLTVSYPTI